MAEAAATGVVFFDHFNALDLSAWHLNWLMRDPTAVSPPVNSIEQTCYSPAQVSVADSQLRLSAVRRECVLEDGRRYPFTSGLVVSSASFLYGRFEASIHTPQGAGLWPAFWLTGGGFEINILEAYGDDRSTYHAHDPDCQGACDGGDLILRGATSGFHTYAVEWLPDSISWFYDGSRVASRTRVLPDVPLRLVLNLGVNSVDAVEGVMRADWVRVTALE